MASDHNGEGYLSALRTETRTDLPDAQDATNALRERLRLRLTVRNVVPGQQAATTGVSAEPPAPVVWNSVLDSLSTGLQQPDGAGDVPARQLDTPSPVATPLSSPHPLNPQPFSPQPFAPQPFAPQPFAPQPLGGYQQLPNPQLLPVPSGYPAGGQIFVPDEVNDDPSAYGGFQRPPNDVDQRDSSLYISRPTTVVTPQIAGMAAPYLAQPPRSASPQRIVASRVVNTPSLSPSTRRPNRHPVRSFLSLLVVLSLLGGAAFTGWYFLIKNKVAWSAELAPMATFVEKAAHADFVDNVVVTTLAVPEYEVKLGIDVLSRSYIDPDGGFATMRAMGLVSGTPSPSEVGHILAATITAYYSPSAQAILRIEGSTPVFQVAMLRALTVALADQTSAWSSNLATATDAQRVGVRASVDTVGVAVVTAKMREDPQLLSLWSVEAQSRTSALGLADDRRATYLIAALGSYSYGATTSPAPTADRPLAGISLPPSDAPLFDPTRSPRRPAPATASSSSVKPGTTSVKPDSTSTTSGPRTLGMQFWYLVMLSSLGSSDARTAALLWNGDSVTTTTVNGQACVSANIATGSSADQVALSGYLLRWAQSRPASSGVTVTDQAANAISVASCEPTEPTTQVMSVVDDATLLYAAASREQRFGEELIRLGLPQTQGAWTCVVRAFRQGVLPNYEQGSTDPAQADVMLNVLALCRNS